MGFPRLSVILILLSCFLSSKSFSQEILRQYWSPNSSLKNIQNILSQLEQDYNLIFSYNSALFQNYDIPNDLKATTLGGLFSDIFHDYNIDYEFVTPKKVLLYKRNIREIRISGMIRDRESKENLPGSIIHILNTNSNVQSNKDGFFFIKSVGQDSLNLLVHSIAFKPQEFTFYKSSQDVILELIFTNVTPTVTIVPGEDPLEVEEPGPPNVFTVPNFSASHSILGGNELLDKVKDSPIAYVGGEMQNGFQVKGGSPYENLVLMDGMPMYEISHIGGISSTFLSAAVKKATLYTTGFPSEFVGRLSSVLDVKVNEGNTVESKSQFGIGLGGVSIHQEIPLIKNKTSLSISGRLNQPDYLINPVLKLIKSDIDYQDLSLFYGDIYGKIHHEFRAFNRLSFTYYRGKDKISLGSEDFTVTSDETRVFNDDHNDLNWGNEIMSLQWATVLKDNLFFNVKLGRSKYTYQEFGDYFQSSLIGNEDYTAGVLSQSDSNISELRGTCNFDLYFSPVGKLKFGFGYIQQQFNPMLSRSLYENGLLVESNNSVETEFDADQYFFYLEDQVKINDHLSFRAGVNWNKYFISNSSYLNIEPRLLTTLKFNKNILNLGASIMHQHISVLVNPGPGLPSNLWITTFGDLSPKKAYETSLDYTNFHFSNFTVYLHGYYKRFENIKDYSSTSDIYFALINNQRVFPSLNLSTEWPDRLIEGKGESYGVSIQTRLHTEFFDFEASYLWSRTFHQFDDIDEGKPFRARNDRPHNATLTLSRKINERLRFNAKWTYGSGTTFTLPIAKPNSLTGEIELIAPNRNNARLDSYHHLDLSLNYKKAVSKGEIQLQFGVYNVYNRRNPFYAYLTQGTDQDDINLDKAYVFPIIPHIAFTYVR